jgi:hypothetical protein
VEPVKESLRARPSRIHDAARVGGGDDVQHAVGQPDLGENRGERVHRERGLMRGLHHHRAARRDRRADLAGAHGHREVPRRDEQRHPDRLLVHQEAARAVRGDGVAAVDAHRLLGEPAEELGGVGDLGPAVGERLAHLQGHEQRKVVDPVHDHLVCAAEDLPALPGRRRRERLLRRGGRGERLQPVLGSGVGDLAERLAGGRVIDGEGAAGRGRAPCPADEQAGGDRVDHPGLVGGRAVGGGGVRHGRDAATASRSSQHCGARRLRDVENPLAAPSPE